MEKFTVYECSWEEHSFVPCLLAAIKNKQVEVRIKQNQCNLRLYPSDWPNLLNPKMSANENRFYLFRRTDQWFKSIFPEYDGTFSELRRCLVLLGADVEDIYSLNAIVPNDQKIFGVLEFLSDSVYIPSLGDEHRGIYSHEGSLKEWEGYNTFDPIFYKLYTPIAVDYVDGLLQSGRKIKFLVDNKGQYDCVGGHLTVEEVVLMENGKLVGFHREVIEELGLMGYEVEESVLTKRSDPAISCSTLSSMLDLNTKQDIDLSRSAVTRFFLKKGVGIMLRFLEAPTRSLPYIVQVDNL